MTATKSYRQQDRLRLKQITGGHEFTSLLARSILLVTVTFLPWHFGGVITGSQVLALIGVVLALVLTLMRAPDRWYPMPKMMLVLIAALLLGGLQLMPLQGGLLKLLSPQAFEYWQLAPNGERFLELATPEQRDAVNELTAALGPPRNSLSLFPAGTRHDLALLLAAIATFFLATQLFANAFWQKVLFALVAANGAVFAFFGIAQKLTWNGQLYGFVPLNQGGLPFAAFVNRNNGACYLNLCLACALGLCIWVAFRQRGYQYEPHRRRRRARHQPDEPDRSQPAVPATDSSSSPRRSRRQRSTRRHRSHELPAGFDENDHLNQDSQPSIVSSTEADRNGGLVPASQDSAAEAAPSGQPVPQSDPSNSPRVFPNRAELTKSPKTTSSESVPIRKSPSRSERGTDQHRHLDTASKEGEENHGYLPVERRSPTGFQRLATVQHRILAGIAQLDGPILYIVLAASFILAGLLFALSRGGWVSTLAGSVALLAILTFTKTSGAGSWVIPTAMFFSLGLMIWLGQSEAVETRFASLQAEFEQPRDGRLDHWWDAWQAARDFLFLGSGIGTYRLVYPIYTDTNQQSLFYHAENIYIEALVEGGLLGLCLLLVSLAAVGVSCYRLLIQREDKHSLACGAVGLFLLVSQAVHACFDFGLYLPANTQLLALLCGAIVGRDVRLHSRSDYRHQAVEPSVSAWTPLFTRFHAAVTVFLITCGIAGILELQSLEAVEAPYFQALKATPANASLQATIEQTEGDSRLFDERIVARADDAEAQLLRGELLTTYRRLLQFDHWRAQQPTTSDEMFWMQTSPALVHAGFLDLLKMPGSPQPEGLDTAELQLFTQTWLASLQAYYATLASCPLLAEAHLRVAQLEPLVVHLPTSPSHLSHARLLAGGKAQLWAEIGFAELQLGNLPQATSDFSHSLQLSGRDPIPLIKSLVQSYPPNVAVAVAPQSPELMVQLARDQFTSEAEEPIRSALLERAEQLISHNSENSAEASYVRGVLSLTRGQTADAIEQIRKAVESQPLRTPWRYELARALLEQGQYDQALEQASLCFHADPQVDRYDELRRAIIRRKLLGNTE